MDLLYTGRFQGDASCRQTGHWPQATGSASWLTPNRRTVSEVRFGLTYRDGQVVAPPEEGSRCGSVRRPIDCGAVMVNAANSALGVSLSKHICREPHLELEAFEHGSPVFRSLRRGGHVQEARMSDEVVNDVVKLRLQAAGMDTKRFGAHSLRSGFITEALRAGHSFKAIMLQTDHISSVAL